MTTTPLAFVDCETTGLTIADEPWEIAIIRRMPGGTDQEFVLHVEHEARLAETLPDEFREDHDTRFGVDYPVYPRAQAAAIVHALLDGMHIVGVNPAFDTGMLERLLAGKKAGPTLFHTSPPPAWPSLTPSWDYHLLDLYALSIGALHARRAIEAGGRWVPAPTDLEIASDDLSAGFGVPTTSTTGEPLYARHTALGDARWARDWWDALTGTGSL